MKTRLIYLLLLIALTGCNNEDVVPVDNSYPLIKSITSYKDGSSTPYNTSTYLYDDKERLIKEQNEVSGMFTPSIITYEYVGDRQVNVHMGSSIHEFHFNEHGDPIKWNDDTFSYVYEPNKITRTVTSDSQSWDTVYTLEDGNVAHSEEADFSYSVDYSYDDKPNYRKSLEFPTSLSNINNLIHEIENNGYEAVYTYVYNEQGYAISMTRTSGSGSYSSVREYEIEYYQ